MSEREEVGHKWAIVSIVSNCPKLAQIAWNPPKLSQIVSNCPKLAQIVLNRLKLSQIVSNCLKLS